MTSAAVSNEEATGYGLATFELNGAPFALHIRLVREINRHLDLTKVCRAPSHVRGLVNLRGQVVTVMDLGTRLGLGARDLGPNCHLIVLKTNSELGEIGASELRTSEDKVGLLVDCIGDVVTPESDDLEPPPSNLRGVGAEFLSSVCKSGGVTVGVLDAESLLKHAQADSVATSATATTE